MNDMISVIVGSEKRPSNWEMYVSISSEMQELLVQLGQAGEKGDHMQIGSILQDRLIPNFEALEEEIKKTNDKQGIRQNLH